MVKKSLEQYGYTRREAFECNVPEAVSGGDVIAIQSGEQTAHIIQDVTKSEIRVPAEIVDVGVGNRVYVLTVDGIIAFSHDGTQLWKQEATPGVQIEADLNDTVLIQTDEESIIGVEGKTGIEDFSFQIPRAETPKDPIIVGTDDGFLIGNWSFVYKYSSTGDQLYEHNLGATIHTLGSISDKTIVAMKNDQTVALEGEKPVSVWRHEIGIQSMSGFGEQGLLAITEEGLMLLGPTGKTDFVTDLSSGVIAANTSLETAIVRNNRTVSIFDRIMDSFDLTGQIEQSEDSLTVSITNNGSAPFDGLLSISAIGAEVSDDTIQVIIPPEETVHKPLKVTPQSEDQQPEITLKREDQIICEKELVQQTASDSDLNIGLMSITNGEANVKIDFSKKTEKSRDVFIEGQKFSTIPAGQRDTIVEMDFEPGVRKEVEIDPYDKFGIKGTVIFPENPVKIDEVSVDESGFLGVKVKNKLEVPIKDILQLEGQGLESKVHRPIELDRGSSLHFTSPLKKDAGSGQIIGVRVEVLRLGISHQTAVKVPEKIGTEGAKTSDKVTHRSDITTSSKENSVEDDYSSKGGTRSAENHPSSKGQRDERPDESSFVKEKEEPTSSGTDDLEVSNQQPTTDEALQKNGNAYSDQSSNKWNDDISVSRRFSSESVLPGEVLVEDLRITNNGNGIVENITLVYEDDKIDVGELPPNSRAKVQRTHSLSRPGEMNVKGEIQAGGAKHSLDSKRVEVSSDGLQIIGGKIDRGNRAILQIWFKNKFEGDVTITGISIKNTDEWHPNLDIASGESALFTESILISELPEDPIVATVDGDGVEKFEDHPFHISERTVIDDVATLDYLDVSITDKTRPVSPRGTLVVTVTNNSDKTVSDVTISASGDAINDVIYGGSERIGELSPSESREHVIDLGVEGATAEVLVTMTANDEMETLTISGPIVGENEDWSQEILSDWDITREESESDVAIEEQKLESKHLYKVLANQKQKRNSR